MNNSLNSVVRFFSPPREENSDQPAAVDHDVAARAAANRWIDYFARDTPDLDQIPDIIEQRVKLSAYDRELIRQELQKRKAGGGK